MYLLGICVAPNHLGDVLVVQCGKQVDLAVQMIQPTDLHLVHQLAGVCAKSFVMDALADFAIVIFAQHLWGDGIILQHIGEAIVGETHNTAPPRVRGGPGFALALFIAGAAAM